jgi:hypothetical protein
LVLGNDSNQTHPAEVDTWETPDAFNVPPERLDSSAQFADHLIQSVALVARGPVPVGERLDCTLDRHATVSPSRIICAK